MTNEELEESCIGMLQFYSWELGEERILDDGYPAIYRRWSRLMCINWDNFREYEQPYFTRNTHEATKAI
jgi:hypothetical protein